MSRDLSLLLLSLFLIFSQCQPADYDLIIRNGLVYDGSLKEPLKADIALAGDKIAAVGDLSEKTAEREIDADGLAVAPGFIDMHVHLSSIRELPEMESLLRQGVTTALGGPDGGGPWPFGAYLDTLQAMGIGANVAYLVGHNTIRRNVMGTENRKPTPEELQQMQAQVEQAMQEGAFGISTGLKYVPGTFSEVAEVIALSEVAAAYGGIYTSHLREEGLGVIEAVGEAISISEKANIPVVLTHHKVMGPSMWGKSTQTLAMVDSARALGLDIMLDQYPYAASQTGLSVLLPSWSRSGGQNAFLKYIDHPVTYDSVKQGTVYNLVKDRTGGDLHRIQFAKISWQPELEGKTLHDWLLMREKEPTPENGAELIIEAQAKGGGAAVYHVMDQGDVDRIMQHPQTMIASDAQLAFFEEGQPHPRWYGTYPRVLGHYVRERGILQLEEAIHKMTLMPAERLGLSDRGRIVEGAYADLVVFDPATVIDKASFAQPHQYPEGIPHVLVNGQLAVDAGVFQKQRAGMVLRSKAYQK
jgi:dihydroorotase/N-acyl-D-amino-acid deacylase